MYSIYWADFGFYCPLFFISDVLNNKTEIDETSGILTPSFIDSSITYTWTVSF